jgi:hypothetical protein
MSSHPIEATIQPSGLAKRPCQPDHRVLKSSSPLSVRPSGKRFDKVSKVSEVSQEKIMVVDRSDPNHFATPESPKVISHVPGRPYILTKTLFEVLNIE